MVAATLIETKAPAKLRTAAKMTAIRGDRARVETLVAIEFAVSWKPFVKSKKSATTTTATSVSSTIGLGVLHDDIADDVTGGLTGVDGSLQPLEDVFPADHHQRVDARVAEQVCDCVANHTVTLVLHHFQLDELLWDTPPALEIGEGTSEMLHRGHEDPALLEGLLGRRFDPVQVEEFARLLDVVDDVVGGCRELVDVLAVERRHVLRVQQLDDVAGDAVPGVLDFLEFGLSHRRVRMLPEADLRLLRGFESIRSRRWLRPNSRKSSTPG